MRRLNDWAFYAGLALLVGAIVQFYALPEWHRLRWPLIVGGLVLVVLSLVASKGDLRATVGTRTVRYGVNTGVAVLLVIGVIGFVEALSYRHNARWDLTENKRFSLSPQTIQVLGNLKTEITATAFFRTDQPARRAAEELLKQYASYGGARFTWRAVDPDREPALARRHGVEAYGTIVLETKTKSEKVLDAEEEKLTNGLVKVTRAGKRVVYVVQGHGEPDLANSDRPGFSEAKSAMEKTNYEVRPLPLAREGKVADDAAVVVLAGPRTELFAPEVAALEAYLGRGGKLLVMVNPPFPQRIQEDALRRFLGRVGVELGDNLVVELSPIGQVFGIGPEVPIIQQYDPHPITRDLAGITTLFPLTRSLAGAKTLPQGVKVTTLAKTSQQSWGETDRDALARGSARPDPQDPKGPLTVALVAEKDKARVVVYGTATLATNQFLNLQGNRDLFLNTVSWLAEEEDQISIRPKASNPTPIFLNSQQAQAVFWLPVVVLPVLAAVGGVVAVVRRRAAK
jgi:ABC-type uncharacterized transport system involved in gliding motility auxiliary subunit